MLCVMKRNDTASCLCSSLIPVVSRVGCCNPGHGRPSYARLRDAASSRSSPVRVRQQGHCIAPSRQASATGPEDYASIWQSVASSWFFLVVYSSPSWLGTCHFDGPLLVTDKCLVERVVSFAFAPPFIFIRSPTNGLSFMAFLASMPSVFCVWNYWSKVAHS